MTSVDVVVITYLRPEVLESCLKALANQTRSPCHVIVVDSSPDTESEDVVRRHPEVTYLRNPSGAANMTNSRNAALTLVDADVISFLDDDAFADENFIEELVQSVESSKVDLGCTRTLNGVPNEENVGRHEVGVITDSGVLLGHFGANPGRDVIIQHGIGASMFFRKQVLAELGGFREDFGGSAQCEDADAFLRARALGYQAVFVHRALVHHVGAPKPIGRRFDWRYQFWSYRNHVVLLANNVGVLDGMLRRYIVQIFQNLLHTDATWSRRSLRLAIGLFGLLRGLASGIRRNGFHPRPPRRFDAEAVALRTRLSG